MTDAHTERGIAAIAKDRADWLVDAVACATQDRRFLRGDPKEDSDLVEVLSPVPIELSKNLGELKPDALPGDMRDSLEYIRDEAGRGLKTHPGQASLVLIQERADAILALI